MAIVKSVSPSSGSSGANGRQWQSPLAPMDVAIVANGDCDRQWRHLPNRHWRQWSIHWRHSLSPLSPNDPFTKLYDNFTIICEPLKLKGDLFSKVLSHVMCLVAGLSVPLSSLRLSRCCKQVVSSNVSRECASL